MADFMREGGRHLPRGRQNVFGVEDADPPKPFVLSVVVRVAPGLIPHAPRDPFVDTCANVDSANHSVWVINSQLLGVVGAI